MAIFKKNITSKMDENGLKYRYRTNLHFDIGLGWLVHEKFFTAAKLRFLAGQASLLDEASTGTQNWSVRAMPTSIQSISVISQTFRPFSVIWGLFWPILAIFGQFWPQIQNCRRLVMSPLKMTARGAEIQWRWFWMSVFRLSGPFRSFGALLGHFWPIFALNSKLS